jgi:hypothetical protein
VTFRCVLCLGTTQAPDVTQPEHCGLPMVSDDKWQALDPEVWTQARNDLLATMYPDDRAAIEAQQGDASV